MISLRFQAVNNAQKHKPVILKSSEKRDSKIFAQNVFNQHARRQFLPHESYQKVEKAIHHGEKIDRELADQISTGMKEWAISKGATHYTHWFQPLNGSSAEKHDAFFHIDKDGTPIEKFSGLTLVQQEPDASSFPSGGIRNTFEARGYTAWDPTSPAFIYGTNLCIPTIFVSYTGEALDYKTPLLRSLRILDKQATAVARYFDKTVKRVNASLGWEQEYFLIDTALAKSRPDITMTGRTLFGHAPAKGQQMSGHYFGSIPTRVLQYMRELEKEAKLLGIPVKTRHNESAPNQFELAPIFEEVNLAVDHNLLLMDIMNKIAEKHNFKVLFHEKPFARVSGSGKHNNWSLATDQGKNLLSPASTPKENLRFLTFFINTIKAVNEYEELLRASYATASNDCRLGSSEAPPAIVSVFIGSQLTKVLNDLEDISSLEMSDQEKTEKKLNVVKEIPEILIDNTDRNRTSTFAFTGNRFELRAVGSSANCANAMTTLNTIVAAQLKKFKIAVDELINTKKLSKNQAILAILKEYIRDTKKIRFEGDGYSKEWIKEAQKRGLSNNKNTPKALKVKVSDRTISLFEELKVMNRREIKARHEIELAAYINFVQIEAKVVGDLARNHIIPTAIEYQNVLVKNVKGLKDIYAENYKKYAKEQLYILEAVSLHIEEINSDITKMINTRKKADEIKDLEKCAQMYCDKIRPFFESIRNHCDELEMLVDDQLWPLTKYRELLFTH